MPKPTENKTIRIDISPKNLAYIEKSGISIRKFVKLAIENEIRRKRKQKVDLCPF